MTINKKQKKKKTGATCPHETKTKNLSYNSLFFNLKAKNTPKQNNEENKNLNDHTRNRIICFSSCNTCCLTCSIANKQNTTAKFVSKTRMLHKMKRRPIKIIPKSRILP